MSEEEYPHLTALYEASVHSRKLGLSLDTLLWKSDPTQVAVDKVLWKIADSPEEDAASGKNVGYEKEVEELRVPDDSD